MPGSREFKKLLLFWTLPNVITLLRIAFVPVVIGLLALRSAFWDGCAAFLFGAVSLTDFLDGYLARRHQQESLYGKFLDPLADKFLVLTSLIFLQDLGRVPSWVVMLMICREMAVTSLRALASAEGIWIGASSSAKWKTGFQMFAVPFLMVEQPFGWVPPLLPLGRVLLWISLAFSLWSGGAYWRLFFQGLRSSAIKEHTSMQEPPS